MNKPLASLVGDRNAPARSSASNERDYTFEELPLLTSGNYSGGYVSGQATIAYHIDDDHSFEWFVHDVHLEAYRIVPGGYVERATLEVERGTQLYTTIWSELTDGSFKQHVHDTVLEWVREEIEG